MGISGLRFAGVAAGYASPLVIDNFYFKKRDNGDENIKFTSRYKQPIKLGPQNSYNYDPVPGPSPVPGS